MRDKALKYGPLVVAKAYADFSEHEGFRHGWMWPGSSRSTTR